MQVKELLGGKACGRRVHEVGKTGTYALKEPVSAYNDVFEGKMGLLSSENKLFWGIYSDISIGWLGPTPTRDPNPNQITITEETMSPIETDQETIKRIFKESLTEALHENRQLFEEIITDVFEDLALSEAIKEGRETEKVSREEIFRTLEQSQ